MKTLKKMIIIIISAALLSSCASLGKPSGASIAAIEDAVNDGSPSKAVKLSGTPFLFEDGILHGNLLLENLFSGMAEAGVKITVDEGSGRVLTADDTALFGSNDETAAFFERYLPAGAFLFEAEWSINDGELLLIISNGENGLPVLRGLGGAGL